MNLARSPIKGSRCKTPVLQPWVGLALCMGLVRSRHLQPFTGSPGGVNRHAECRGRFGARLWDLIRCTRQPPTQLKLRGCGSPCRLTQPERDFANLRPRCGRPEGSTAKGWDTSWPWLLAVFSGGWPRSRGGIGSRWPIVSVARLSETASGPTCRASPAISNDWFMRGPDHVPGPVVAAVRGLDQTLGIPASRTAGPEWLTTTSVGA